MPPKKVKRTEDGEELQEGSLVRHKTRGRGTVQHINSPESVTVAFDDGTGGEFHPDHLEVG